MSDQNPQDPRVVTIDADRLNGQGTKVDGTQQPVASEEIGPVSPSKAVETPTPPANRTFAYGAIAATIGIVAGLAFASFAGRMDSRSGPAAAGSANSNAAAQAELVKPQAATPADANTSPGELPAAQTPSDPQPVPSSHKKARRKDLDGPARFAIEGDDELVEYDPSRGVIQTSARKTFLVSRTTVGGNSSAWQDGPANIHYKCDLNAACTLPRSGAAVLYAQLKK